MSDIRESDSNNKGSHYHRYLHYAAALIKGYKGNEPFHSYLKKYFSANKKHGSRDRKLITALCYGYFRLGQSVPKEMPVEEKLLLGYFFSSDQSTPLLASLKPDWNERVADPILAKIDLVKEEMEEKELFPFKEELSNEINFEIFNASFLEQPKLFIRIRPGKHQQVIEKLKAAKIPFEKESEDSLTFANTQKLTEVLKIDEEAVIQDYNSQRVTELILAQPKITGTDRSSQGGKISIWDCCAASGGKSISMMDYLTNVDLTVSDNRKEILQNLKSRFSKAGIRNYTPFVADLASNTSGLFTDKHFDLVLVDAPCTGSGTWGRTPEQMHYSSIKSIEKYASLQRSIVANTIPYLKENGFLLYVTCSVFKKENEENVQFIQDKLGLELLENRYLKGYDMGADTLYAAMFRKTSDSDKK
ncbi:MAG: RsmB/NOP family class I SAM-dependent RNA methyltransferase [Ginsengibacter sp.]